MVKRNIGKDKLASWKLSETVIKAFDRAQISGQKRNISKTSIFY